MLLFSFITNAQDTKIRFFGHPGFDYTYNTTSKEGSPYFRSGPFVVFATSQLTEKISVAGELNAHIMALTGSETEIERIFVRYYHNDFLSFRLGRMYTPLGYWNLNYNFGLILQPTISRPGMLQPTHDAGFNSTRDAGLQIEGERIGNIGFFYKVFFSNGLGKNGGIQGNPFQLGNTLASSVQLGIEPKEGFKFLVSGMYNRQEKNSTNQFGIVLPEDIQSTALNGSIIHMNSDKKFELIAEYFLNNRNYGQKDYPIHSALVYAGYKLGEKWVPYVYSEAVEFSRNDLYFPPVNVYTNRAFFSYRRVDLGIRYKLNPNMVLKTELGVANEIGYGVSLGGKTQVAFSF